MFKASKEAAGMTQLGSGREMEEVKPEREKDQTSVFMKTLSFTLTTLVKT